MGSAQLKRGFEMFRVLTITLSFVAGATAQCNATSDGKFYDLTSLQNATLSPVNWTDDEGTFTYSFQACGTHDCGGDPASLCQHSNQFLDNTNLAIWTGVHDQALFQPPSSGVGINAIFNNGASCGSQSRNTTITLQCDKTATVPKLTSVVEDPTCVYTAIVVTAASCTPGKGGGGGGLSLGDILLIIIPTTFALYLIIGFALLKRKAESGASCTDSIPNIDMWRALPGLTADGCKFTVNKLKGLCGKGGGSGGGDFERIE